MANPDGKNGLHVPGPAYGDVKRQTQLLREAPISGAPVSAAAVDAPRRAKRAAVRGGAPAPGPVPVSPVAAPVAAPELPYPQQLAALTQQLASVPGAGQNVLWLAQQAQAPGVQ